MDMGKDKHVFPIYSKSKEDSSIQPYHKPSQAASAQNEHAFDLSAYLD